MIVVAWFAFWTSMGSVARAADRAELLDPRVLEEPIGAEDPLENLKYLWQGGAQGLFFQMESVFPVQCGAYLAVEDWTRVDLRPVDSAVWFRDAELLGAIRRQASAGTRVLVQNRVPIGGLHVSPDDFFQTALRRIAPGLAARSMVVLNGFSKLYSLQHEMVHHLDYESGLLGEIVDAVNALFEDPDLTVQQLTDVVFYIIEGRAYHTELESLLANSRPVEFAATLDDDEFTRVTPTDGPDFRRYLFAFTVYNFNQEHAKKFQALPDAIRDRVTPLLPKYIPNYPRDFTPTGEMNEARCRRNIPGDGARGIGVMGDWD